MHSGGFCFLCKLWGSHKGAKFKAHSWQYLNPRLTRARSKKKKKKKKRIILRTSFKKLFATVITSPSHTQPEEREESACVCVLTPLCWTLTTCMVKTLHYWALGFLSHPCAPPANHKRTLSRSLSSTPLAKIKKYLKSKFFKWRWVKQASRGLKIKKLTSKGPPHTQTHTLEDLTSLFRVLLLPLRLKLPSWKRSRRGGRRGCGRAFLFFFTPPSLSFFLFLNTTFVLAWGGGGRDPAYLTPGLSLDTHLPSSILWWSPH